VMGFGLAALLIIVGIVLTSVASWHRLHLSNKPRRSPCLPARD
jgi:uncharacterized membrane protein YidH (DUF202 family)